MKSRILPAAAQHAGAAQWRTAGLAGFVAAVVAAWALRWPSLHAPLQYESDTLLVWSLVKGLAEQKWPFYCANLGLPGTLAWIDFPIGAVGQLGLLKGLTMFGLSPLAAINSSFFLGFALTGGIAARVLQHWGVEPALAFLGALAYALLPYHFLRMPGHLFLSAYYLIPWCSAVVLAVAQAEPIVTPRLWRYAGFCFAAAVFNDIYYTFFFCYLLVSVGGLRCFAERRLQPLGHAAVALAGNVGGAAMALMPSLWSRWQRIEPQIGLVRPARDSERYGLKFVQMLVPAPDHANATLAKLTQAYSTTAPLVNENSSASLGLVLAAALLVTTAYWLCTTLRPVSQQPPADSCEATLRILGILSMLAFLFGTVGGFGVVFAYGVSPYIRSTNRIVIFIAFFVVAAACLLAQRACGAAAGRKQTGQSASARRIAYAMVLGCLLWDTHDINWFPKVQQNAAIAAQDHTFFAEMQSRLAAGSRIYQLPYVTFPEGGYASLDYSQMTPYLHTHTLLYSFGAMRGARADLWSRQTAMLFHSDDWEGLARRLRGAGFSSVLLNQRIPMHDAETLLSHLTRVFGAPQMQSPDKAFVLFSVPRSS